MEKWNLCKIIMLCLMPRLCEFNQQSKDVFNSLYVRHEGCTDFKYPDENEKSIFLLEAHGRLGNHLLIYALILQLSKSLGIVGYVNDVSLYYLEKYFTKDSIKVKSIQREFCDYNKIRWEFYVKHIRHLLVDKAFRTGRTIYLFPKTKQDGDYNGYKAEKHSCPEHDKLSRAYGRTVRKTLKFKPELIENANNVFKEVSKKLKVPLKKVTFIAIHNRRTDHINFVKKVQNKKPLKASYFYDAMEKFREDYDHPAFLFVSDDMEWAKKNVKNKHNDLFYVSEGKDDDDSSIGTDLAIMALSNATIISRGTFSTWGAVLNGGEVHSEYGFMMPADEMYPMELENEDLFF